MAHYDFINFHSIIHSIFYQGHYKHKFVDGTLVD